MVERILILAAVAIVVFAIWVGLRFYRTLTLKRMAQHTPFRHVVPDGKPAVVAFSTPSCRDCRTLQAPALSRLKTAVNDRVTILSLSALEHPDLVNSLGILTVPSTVVVDANGKVKMLNLGYTSDTRLIEQLSPMLN